MSVGRILRRDWPSFGLSVVIGVCGLVAVACYLTVAVEPPEGGDGRLIARVMGAAALSATALCGPVLVWRVRVIRRVFARGEVVRGQVLLVGENAEDVGYAVIAYRYRGREYRVTNVTEGVVGRGGLAPDESVDVVVDPGKPSRAFVAKLYLEER